jgi:hypothetical protein
MGKEFLSFCTISQTSLLFMIQKFLFFEMCTTQTQIKKIKSEIYTGCLENSNYYLPKCLVFIQQVLHNYKLCVYLSPTWIAASSSTPSYTTRHPLPALHKTTEIDQPIHIHPEDGNCNACWNIGQLPIFDATYTQK